MLFLKLGIRNFGTSLQLEGFVKPKVMRQPIPFSKKGGTILRLNCCINKLYHGRNNCCSILCSDGMGGYSSASLDAVLQLGKKLYSNRTIGTNLVKVSPSVKMLLYHRVRFCVVKVIKQHTSQNGMCAVNCFIVFNYPSINFIKLLRNVEMSFIILKKLVWKVASLIASSSSVPCLSTL